MKRIATFAEQFKNLALAAVLSLSIVASVVPSLTAATVQNLTPMPRISFTFDDGLTSALAKAAPTLATYGLKATDYVITGCVGMTTTPNTCAADETVPYMSWDQVTQLQSTYGWEIASHTASHPQLATDKPSANELNRQLTESQQVLQQHGFPATDLAFPYGDYDSNVLAQTAKYYESARGFWDIGFNTWPYDNTTVVNQQVQVGEVTQGDGGVSVAEVKAVIDQAIANNQWLVLTFHDIKDSPNMATDSYDYATADLAAIAAYAKQKQDANLAKVVTVSDGLVRGTNMLPNGDFASGIASGWTTDDATNIIADAGVNGRYPEPTHAVSLKSSSVANAASRDGNSHLFSPMVNVTSGQTYIIKNYLNMTKGGTITFAVDEYDANGNWISWVDPSVSRAYNTAANAINVSDVSFSYTPSSANVAKAALQVIVRYGENTQAYYDGAQWLWTGEIAGLPTDVTAPAVSGVTATTTATGATINWTTDEASDTQVAYGATTAYGLLSTLDATKTTSHSVTISGLTAGTTYHYKAMSKDAAGNIGASTDLTFTTAAGSTGKVGDLTGPTGTPDGKVNDSDLSKLLFNWNKTGATAADGDLSGPSGTRDGVINDSDLSVLLFNWTKE